MRSKIVLAAVITVLGVAPYTDLVWLHTCGENWCVTMGPAQDGTLKPRSSP
jgi:hypothetical protein